MAANTVESQESSNLLLAYATRYGLNSYDRNGTRLATFRLAIITSYLPTFCSFFDETELLYIDKYLHLHKLIETVELILYCTKHLVTRIVSEL